MSRRWPAWLHEALRLSPEEVARVRPGLSAEDLRALREASAASEEAVALLIRRARAPARRAAPWPALAAAVAASLLAVFGAARWISPAPTAYDPPDVALAEALSLVDRPIVALGPSIGMDGLADVIVEQADASGTVVRVLRGAARFEVDPDGPHRSLAVRAGDVIVRVRGTRFVVHALHGSVHVDVLRGEVEIERDGAVRRVAAGQSWSHDAGAAALTIASAEPLVVAGDEPLPGPVEASALATGGPAAPTLAASPRRDTAPAPPPVDEGPPPPPRDAGLEAAAIFDQLDAGDPPELVAREVDAFLRQWPDSHLAPELGAIRLELAARLETPEAVIRDVDRWLLAWPDHPRRLDLLELRATLARDGLRDCALALPSYRTLAEAGDPTRRARAHAWAGLCAAELGERDAAVDSLRRARDLGVDPALGAEVEAALERLAPR